MKPSNNINIGDTVVCTCYEPLPGEPQPYLEVGKEYTVEAYSVNRDGLFFRFEEVPFEIVDGWETEFEDDGTFVKINR